MYFLRMVFHAFYVKDGIVVLFISGDLIKASGRNQYTFNDESRLVHKYYRIAAIDIDGKKQYSEIVLALNSSSEVKLLAVPGSVHGVVNVQHPVQTSAATLTVLSLDGKVLAQQKVLPGTQQTQITGLATNTYIVQLRSTGKLASVKVFLP